ncbi:MAG: DUF167 domain-containing protein [Betaproteobacteria bacterium]|nr:DUF167 domain-containing protein [Betaproteobacteria bacterium]
MTETPLPSWLLAHRDGCVVLVSAQPGARRSELAGLHDGTLRVRVAAPALEGRANEALREWLATQLHCAVSRVRLLRGDKSRRKQLLVELEPAQVLARIGPLLAQAQ